MKVRLINKTPKMMETLYTAAHACYSDRMPDDIFENGPIITEKEQIDAMKASNNPSEYQMYLNDLKKSKMLKTVRGCIARNHNTVMRHVYFTFSISEVSRVTMAQITRHHAGIDFDVQSQRYVTMDEKFKWALPDVFYSDLDESVASRISAFLQESKDLYQHLVQNKIMHKEDARYLLPNAAPTNMTCTANLAAFMHLYRLRAKDATGKAQDEIKELTKLMAEEVAKSEPWIAEFLK